MQCPPMTGQRALRGQVLALALLLPELLGRTAQRRWQTQWLQLWLGPERLLHRSKRRKELYGR